MDDFNTYVRNKFDGILAFGDVHGDFKSIQQARDYARKENFFFLSMGDLVDRGREPYETVALMYDAIIEGDGGFVIGNHDDKMYRFAQPPKAPDPKVKNKHRPMQLSADALQTMADVGEDRKAEFQRMYCEIIDKQSFSAFYHKFDDIVFVHAAMHPDMWDDQQVKVTKEAKSRYIFGDVNGEWDADGFPVRLYGWIDEIPKGKTVIVGHDRKPIHNIAITEPMVRHGAAGGTAVFIDTGCGKGGFLTAAIVMPDKNKKNFSITGYKVFKDE